jgi:hypothetical protein
MHSLRKKWEVLVLPNDHVTIRNLQSNTYLSYSGSPVLDKEIGGYPDQREWVLYTSSHTSTL